VLWTSVLANPTAIQKIFGGDPPELRQVRVHEVTLSRDGPQVMIRFDLPTYPAEPAVKWKSQGFNTVQVQVVFVGAWDVSLRGFGRDPLVDIDITKDDAVRVTIDSNDLDLRFSADAVTLSRVSAYMNG
jgi:hypothetical protein